MAPNILMTSQLGLYYYRRAKFHSQKLIVWYSIKRNNCYLFGVFQVEIDRKQQFYLNVRMTIMNEELNEFTNFRINFWLKEKKFRNCNCKKSVVHSKSS